MSLFRSFWKKDSKEAEKTSQPGKWQVGDKIANRYEIRDIKWGGMAFVYICYDPEINRLFAVKTPKDEYLLSEDCRKRFHSEAETWVKLGKHDNIVRAFWVQDFPDYRTKIIRPIILLEYISGEPSCGPELTGWIRKQRLTITLISEFGIQICDGLIYAEKKFNERGEVFVHRDIKPSNILITDRGVVKLSDFGLVKAFAALERDIQIEPTAKGASRIVGFTKTGNICGTLPYMPPEQCRGEKNIDVRSDIYSFGCVLYEMLTGGYLFDAVTTKEFIHNHLNTIPRRPKTIVSSIPVRLDALVMKCLEKNRNNRYQNFEEIRDQLSGLFYDSHRKGATIKQAVPPVKPKASELVLHGTNLANLGNYSEALEYLNRALDLDPHNVLAWTQKGVVMKDLKRYTEALNCYEKALELKPKDNHVLHEVWHDKADLALTEKRWADTVSCCEKALRFDQNVEVTWFMKGVALFNLGQYDQALDSIERTLVLNPEHAPAQLIKADLLLKHGNRASDSGKHEEAISYYDKALVLEPKFAEAYYGKANALARLGRYREAINPYQKFIELASPEHTSQIKQIREQVLPILRRISPSNEVMNQGVALASVGKYQEAVDFYNRALEIDPNYTAVWVNKGAALSNLGRSQEALYCCDKALEIDIGFPGAWYSKGLELAKMGKRQEATACFKKFIELASPQDVSYVREAEEYIRQLNKMI